VRIVSFFASIDSDIVAGIMIFLSFAELLPYAFKHSKKRDAVAAVHIGIHISICTITDECRNVYHACMFDRIELFCTALS